MNHDPTEHHLLRVDRTPIDHLPERRRAICVCGSTAYCGTRGEAGWWIKAHRMAPEVEPAVLATIMAYGHRMVASWLTE